MADDDLAYYEAQEVAEDNKICKIYDSDDFFTVFVQMLLAFLALVSLWFKRQNEKPKRKFRTWFLDVFKQGLGACYAHVCNMVIAAVIIGNQRGEENLSDQCAWYGMCYLVDTTLGLLLSIWGLKLVDVVAHKFNIESLKETGVYEGPNGNIHFVHQVFAWILIQSVVKMIVYFFMVYASAPLAFVGSILFAPFQINIRFELLFVMIFFPGFLNVIYFWIADSYLQAKSTDSGAHEIDPEEQEQANARKESLLAEEEKKPYGTLV